MKLITNLFFCSLLTVLVGCSSESSTLLIGTTTSTENTGLMDMLIDRFEGETDYEVKLVTAGTGAALKMAERGDLDRDGDDGSARGRDERPVRGAEHAT